MSQNRIIHKVTLRYLLKNRKRTLFTLTSILLMVVLMTCVFVGKDTLITSFTNIAEAEKGKWHVNLYDIDRDQYEQLIQQPFVEESGISEHLSIFPYEDSPNPQRPYLDLRSYSMTSMDWFNLSVIDGRLPQNENEIVVSQNIRNDGSPLQIGDTISFIGYTRHVYNNSEYTKVFPFQQVIIEPYETIETDITFPYFNDPEIQETLVPTGFEKTYTVVGFIEIPSFESSSSAGYTAITFSDNIPSDHLFNLSLRVNDDSSDMYSIIKAIAGDHYEVNNYVMVFTGNSSNNTINQIVLFAEVFLAGLILLVSVVLLNNVFSLSYDERMKYLSTLASVGATGRQKRSSVYFEALFLLGIALPIGFIGGIVLIKVIVTFMKPAAAAFLGIHITKDIPVKTVLHLSSILQIFICCVMTVLISAIIPAQKIAKSGAIAGIRGNARQNKKHTSKTRKQRSAEAMLANGFLHMENKQSDAIFKAMCVFITVMITITYTSSALIQMVTYKLSDTVTIEEQLFSKHEYLLAVMGDSVLFDNAITKLQETNGIKNANTVYDMINIAISGPDVYSGEYLDAYRDVMRQYENETIDEEQLNEAYVNDNDFFASLTAVDDALFQQIAKDANAVSFNDGMINVILLKEGYVSTDTYSVFGRSARNYRYYTIDDMIAQSPGDTVSLSLNGQQVDLFVCAKVSQKQLADRFNFSDYKLHGLISISDAKKWLDSDILDQLDRYYLFDIDDTNSSLTALMNDLRNMERDDVLMIDHSEYLPETIQSSLKALIRITLISFVILTSIICFLNILTSMNGLITYRRKTFASLKAIGMHDTQLWKMMVIEMAHISLRSVICACICSGLLCLAIQKQMVQAFGNFTVPIPYIALTAIILCTTSASLLCEWYTYRKENNAVLIEEIRKESI